MINQNKMLSNVLKINNLYFEEIVFKATGENAEEGVSANVGFHEDHCLKQDMLDIRLVCEVDVENVFEMRICLKGIFEVGDKENVERFVPNAIAIMFPYLRSQVSLLTAQPNTPTIVLKPININKFLEESKRRKN